MSTCEHSPLLGHSSRRRITQEIGIVVLITFGMSGFRALVTLIGLYLDGGPATSSVVLNPQHSTHPALDVVLRMSSAAVLIGWGLLALFLLRAALPRLSARQVGAGVGLAALIGLPGLGLYVAGRALGLSREVIPATDIDLVVLLPLVVWAFANAFAEEVVVVWWLSDRLSQLGWRAGAIIAASAALRGSYHLYQGIPAGVGNIVMGVVFAWVFLRYRRIWPLILGHFLGHFLIDAVAFVGYPLLVAAGVHIPGVL
ncbi:CPBP family intramembrane metalloprotease [Corynebacterium sp. 13CS0277]|uniref:CPBP family intramembrane glutamic endopeptidase n=1 Tax=Corynebacterium sp. 13CS0277 TaxID=2071994 RepID=UPI000D03A6DB|nr:CPBP family intramembrane glutamic endopeptidase [Corynebacterium sp. 13CS0277]PRQ10493.1 CPBP family intramembrane metalloprotease [Corynebacterium sp. 13CS0277]